MTLASENTARTSIPDRRSLNALKTHCPQGHAYTPENTYWAEPCMPDQAMRRQCRACQREMKREWARRQRKAPS